jgi:hypothetical protein
MALSPSTRQLARTLHRMLRSGRLRPSQLRAAVAKSTSRPIRGQHILDLSSQKIAAVSGGVVGIISSGLWLPTGVTKAFVQLAHHYSAGGTFLSSLGSAAANITNGSLSSIAAVNLSKAEEWCTAAIDIRLPPTTVQDFGRLSRITFEPEIAAWNGTTNFFTDWKWISENNIAGAMTISGVITLAAYEFNPATRLLEQLPPPSAVVFTLFQDSFHGAGGGEYSHGGRLLNGAASLQVLADPGKRYVLRLMAQLGIVQNLTNDRGRTPPPPPSGGFNCSGVLTVSVPAMWVTHVVLAH